MELLLVSCVHLTVSVNIFDYLSTPFIFVVLGLEILYFDQHATLDGSELAAVISKVRLSTWYGYSLIDHIL